MSDNNFNTQAELILSADWATQGALPTGTCAESKWQPWLDRDARICEIHAQLDKLDDLKTRQKAVEMTLSASHASVAQDAKVLKIKAQIETLSNKQKAFEVALRVERALLHSLTGRSHEAINDHLKVLELEPSHRPNLIGLGHALNAIGKRKAAKMVYTEAVKQYPEDILIRVHLGALLLHEDDPLGAREQYEAALRIDPEFPQAHGGMYYALSQLGEVEEAETHRRKCFGQQIFPAMFRGDSQPISVLLLVSSKGGNTPIEKLLNDRVFQTFVVITDFYDSKTSLPAHQIVVNGIGDMDVAEEALAGAESLLALTSSPVLNAPAAVRATRRCDVARRLSGVPWVVSPRTATLSRESLAISDVQTTLTGLGFEFPLLLRTPGFHGGKYLLRVESLEELPDALAQLPGNELTVIQYLDARGPDGKWRKYRVMMIDGHLYPLHAAISSHWKIHYFSADMTDYPEHRAEDAAFIENMGGVLGPRAMAALEEIQKTLGLDYGGIDFGLNEKGEILLFEANATMIVVPPDADQRWDYRRPAVERIHSAVWKMLVDRSNGASRQDGQSPSTATTDAYVQ